jgi:hypothetical protein
VPSGPETVEIEDAGGLVAAVAVAVVDRVVEDREER